MAPVALHRSLGIKQLSESRRYTAGVPKGRLPKPHYCPALRAEHSIDGPVAPPVALNLRPPVAKV